ncbi:unnamed protein product [Rhizophagus irregularis]|nr:unnamed protein product [Rhizophagus irregularis]
MEKPSFVSSKLGSGGLPCSEEQENSKDSIWWASEERKTKKPRFVSFGFGWIGFNFGLWAFDSIGCDILGLWICIGCDISLAGFGSIVFLNEF